MSMRASPGPHSGSKPNADAIGGTFTLLPLSLRRESRDSPSDVPDNFRWADRIPSRSKRSEQTYMSGDVSEVAEANRAAAAAVGVLSPVGPMGGEGTPVKGKPLSVDSMENPQMAQNNNTPKEADGVLSAASIEVSSEGKWKNLRKSPANPHTQANCLRQILLLQLDLIEQQQQQLQSKDKEIDDLKADKETLLARIERMERRLQLTKKDPPRDKRLFQPLEPWTPDKEDMWDLEVEESPQPNPSALLPLSRGGKGQKRKSCFGESKLQKSRGKSAKLSPHKVESQPASPSQRELRSKETPEKSAAPGLPCKEEADLSCQMEDLPFLSTTEMYLCCWNQPPVSPLRETSPKKDEEEEVANASNAHSMINFLFPSSCRLSVPSWRENFIEPLGEDLNLDAQEPLDDGVFLKRHAKLELDEKRRKRWDIQRIREQRMFQRLQQRMNRKKIIPETEPELSSFYPETEDVEAIMITPFLPVVAFGRPLPKLTQENFDLPWLDERSRCRVEVPKKHTPHRTCRK
ncbi:male-specific lethal 1 homolog [Syngnathoides biaculeatus]|uniref:male-specific lethal 1 homolog n=1 Tax=Syngnathoides biaculeatus TaxID=300417 RepID=UPI002ADD9CE4|nr:male-specific lethal 1 homolog [Syngnathoides biaculeatus]XP_061666901.1 male-specific lethal 1 homolog [Syngnathoides biaculeatus]XP_061666902.1 male-specific lethal 1 homolog [Syngnathoides biaculeatus]